MTHRVFTQSRRLLAWVVPIIVPVMLVVLARAQSKGAAPGKGGSAEYRALKNPVPATPATNAEGAARYKKYCAFCHADDGKGDGPLAPKDSHPPDLTDAEWTHGSSDGEIFMVIQVGLGEDSDMKPFAKKISEMDTWKLVNYLKTLRKASAR